VELSNLTAHLLGNCGTWRGSFVGALVATAIAILDIFCVANLVVGWTVHCDTLFRISIGALFLVLSPALLVQAANMIISLKYSGI
jgi:hypothetical protein